MKQLFITQQDLSRLKDAIKLASAPTERGKRDLALLSEELDHATIVKPEDIPPHMVTMNSMVSLKNEDNGSVYTWKLVYPHKADIDNGCISVLAPLGMAMLGHEEGDTFEWETASGTRRLTIMKLLYQPEAAGNLLE